MKKFEVSKRGRWLSLLGLFLMLGSMFPTALTAQGELNPVGEIAQADSPAIEVLLLGCEPGTSVGTDVATLRSICDEGLYGVGLQVTSVDPGLGIDLPKTSVPSFGDGTGPGVINTGALPNGEFSVAIDLDTTANSFQVACHQRTSHTDVAVTAVDNTFQVRNDGAEDIVCEVFVISHNPIMNITYRDCTRADFPDATRTWDALSTNCLGLTAPTPQLTVRDMNVAGQPETPYQFDASGEVTIPLTPGTFEMFTDLSMDQWGEYLFCEYEGQPRYEKDFHPTRGIVEFTGLLLDEEINCNWFAVQATGESGEVTPPPVVPDADASLEVHLSVCPVDYTGSSWYNDCHSNGLADMEFDLTGTGGTLTQTTVIEEADGPGIVRFTDLVAGDYVLAGGPPQDFGHVFLYCSDPTTNAEVTSVFENYVGNITLADGQSVVCDWYYIPEDMVGPDPTASLEVHLAICPAGYTGTAWYADCHDSGLADMEFILTGPGVDETAATTVPATPGPGIVVFDELPAGDYVLAGGPPQDFGSVFLFCSDPATTSKLASDFVDGMGHFAIADGQNIVCDWYFIPDPGEGPADDAAELMVTVRSCPSSVALAGIERAQLDSSCTTTVDGIAMSLKGPVGAPVTQNTGSAAPGAVHFLDMAPGNHVLSIGLPTDMVNVAIYCTLDGGTLYQKAISGNATTFVRVETEDINCTWYIAEKPDVVPELSGSITVREMLCADSLTNISDWERECVPGPSGASFTIKSSDGTVVKTVAPGNNGVAVFATLPDGYYSLSQNEGAWCRAKAERVDSQSRVIVAGGGNTTVFIYQCDQDLRLPDTGSGSALGYGINNTLLP